MVHTYPSRGKLNSYVVTCVLTYTKIQLLIMLTIANQQQKIKHKNITKFTPYFRQCFIVAIVTQAMWKTVTGFLNKI